MHSEPVQKYVHVVPLSSQVVLPSDALDISVLLMHPRSTVPFEIVAKHACKYKILEIYNIRDYSKLYYKFVFG